MLACFLCVELVHKTFIRAKSVTELEMHGHCWGHMAEGMSLGRGTGYWTEEPLMSTDEKGNIKLLPLGFGGLATSSLPAFSSQGSVLM